MPEARRSESGRSMSAASGEARPTTSSLAEFNAVGVNRVVEPTPR